MRQSVIAVNQRAHILASVSHSTYQARLDARSLRMIRKEHLSRI